MYIVHVAVSNSTRKYRFPQNYSEEEDEEDEEQEEEQE